MTRTPAGQPRRILVIKWGALGDLVAATTGLRALRDAYPSSHITLLANPLMEQVCPAGTLVDRILPLERTRDGMLATVQSQWTLVRALRRGRFDLAVNLRWTSERSAVLAALSGAPMRAGSGPASCARLYTHRALLPTGRRHEFQRHLDILEPLGIVPDRILPFVYMSDDDGRFAAEFFHAHGLRRETTVGMHPGASKPSKAWPADRYAELARRFAPGTEMRTLITWGPGEEALARETVERAGGGTILAPPTPGVGSFAALIHLCGVYVCNYSGPMNVAMAVETPLVALGSTSPEDWGPFGDIHRTINKSGEQDSYTEDEQLAMMKQISVDEVEALVQKRRRELYGKDQ
jgi:ADP-heptose:LPS heptosyltransferase